MKRFVLQFILMFSVIIFLTGCLFPAQKKIEDVYQGLFDGADLSSITTDLHFPTYVDGVEISWYSNDWDVIDSDGRITRGEEDQTVMIDVSLTYQGSIELRKFEITVLKRSLYPISKVTSANENELVTVNGNVVGTIGNSIYLHDGVDGIVVENVEVTLQQNEYVVMKGIKQTKENMVSLLFEEKLPSEGISFTLPIIKANDFSQIAKLYYPYKIEQAKIVALPSEDDLVGDITFVVEDSLLHQFDIVIPKNHRNYTSLKTQVGLFQLDDKINMDHLVFTSLSNQQFTYVEESTYELFSLEPQEAFYPNLDDMVLLDELLTQTDITVGIPSLGTTHALIIPVDFTDYRFSQTDLEKLDLAFFGTSEQTGWESVKSYYEKSSFGKFTFQGTILDTFHTNRQASYYSQLYKRGFDADYEIVKAALEYYDAEIDYSLYDQNNDNYIDALYFIYAAPVYFDDVPLSTNNVDLWWAYVYQYFTDDYEYYDGVEANYYLWAGLDFIDEPLIDDGFDSQYITANAATYIHETGHMLGLEDYYDYDDQIGLDGGLGGADMMDFTVGDHNPFSKMILGWVNPLVVTEQSITVTLKPFSTSGEVILIANKWNDTYYDEYLLIDFYTPTHLNEAHADYNGLFSDYGVRIFHVDAIVSQEEGSSQNEDGYYSVFSYNNSDTNRKLIKLIEADGNYSIESTAVASNTDLYIAGDIFGKTSYPSYRWYDGDFISFTIEILSITQEEAIITITYK